MNLSDFMVRTFRVRRRAKRAITDFEKQLVVNTDDLSVAAMYFGKG